MAHPSTWMLRSHVLHYRKTSPIRIEPNVYCVNNPIPAHERNEVRCYDPSQGIKCSWAINDKNVCLLKGRSSLYEGNNSKKTNIKLYKCYSKYEKDENFSCVIGQTKNILWKREVVGQLNVGDSRVTMVTTKKDSWQSSPYSYNIFYHHKK